MGILSKLFGTGGFENDPIPQLNTILPQTVVQTIEAGKLPNLISDKLVLRKGELCHFVDVGAAVTERKHYQSRRRGSSVRIAKGWVLHNGSSTSVPVVTREITRGYLYITNQRIVFVAHKHGFEKRLKQLTAITPYDNGLELQFGDKIYVVALPNGTWAKQVLDQLI